MQNIFEQLYSPASGNGIVKDCENRQHGPKLAFVWFLSNTIGQIRGGQLIQIWSMYRKLVKDPIGGFH